MSTTKQARAWCFTENDEPLCFEYALKSEGLPVGVKYLVGQLEQGEHLHFQGYCQLANSTRLSWLKKHLSATAHFEPARGSFEHNKAYCTKEDTRVGDPIELGVPPAQGKRSDWNTLKADLETPSISLVTISETYTDLWMRYRGSIKEYRTMHTPPRTCDSIHVELHYGVPGSGKSTACALAAPNAYHKAPQNKWWDGYEGQTEVIFNDFGASWFSWTLLMNILDHYECRVETKGGFVQLLATKFYISSNKAYDEWYQKKEPPVPVDALYRRLHSIFYYGSKYPCTPLQLK